MAEKIKVYRWKYTETDNSNDGVFNGYLQVDYAPHIVPFSYLTEIDPTMELKGKITKVELSMVFLRDGSSKVSVDTKFSLSNSRGESYESDGWVTTSGITNIVTPAQFFPMTNPPPINFFSAKDYTLKIEHRNATRSEIVSPSGNFVDLRIFYEETTIPVSSITLSSTSLTLIEGGTQTLTATVYPDNATNKNLSWSSNNTSVATVDDNGKVTALSAGSATITCAAKDESGKYAACLVSVSPADIKITSISIPSSYSMVVGDSVTLSPVIIEPFNATNQNLLWGTYNPDILTVIGSTGQITAKKQGEAEVDASAQDGSGITSNRCRITVSSKIVGITSINLNKTSITLEKGDSIVLSYTPNPSNASIGSVRWISNNSSIASVSDGIVTALNPGETSIVCYVTDKNEEEVSASCSVKVTQTDTPTIPPETSTKHVYININGTYIPAVAWIKTGGVWKECTAVYVNKSGYWYDTSAE